MDDFYTEQSSAKKIKKKRRRFKQSFITMVIYTLMIFGWYTMMFPKSADLLNRIFNQNSILSYNSTMASYSDEEIAQILQDCIEYNNSIYEEQQITTYHYRGPTAAKDDDTYNSLPTASIDIGTLRIPSINVNVTFGHGTDDSLLQAEAGHLYGTSLPISGENVHSVIAAHSALTTAELFTDLGKVKIGDSFYVTVLNTEYEYKVNQIKTVLPEDDYKYEQIETGENYVTLYTCTPYGVNTHRLLVRGELVGQKQKDLSENHFNLNDYMGIITNASLLALIILAPFILVLIAMIKEKRAKKKALGNNIGKQKNVHRKEKFHVFHKKKANRSEQ